MTRVVVHAGFIRTATTTLQVGVFPSLAGVNYLGLPSRQPAVDAAIRALCTTDSVRYEPGPVRNALLGSLDPARVNVVSYENLASFKAKDKGSIACRLKDVFSDAQIVFTIRNQHDLVKSWYLYQRQPNRAYVKFDRWWEQVERLAERGVLGDLDFDDTIARYEQLFGRERVGVFLYETLRDAPAEFAQGLADFAGLDAPPIATALRRHRLNVGATRRHLYWAGFVAYCVPGFVSSACRRIVPEQTAKRFQHWQAQGKRPVIALTPEQHERISTLCASGNRRLIERRGLPLERFGYAV